MFNEGVKLLFHRKIDLSYLNKPTFYFIYFLGEIADILAKAATGTSVEFLDFEEIIDKPRTIRSLKALHIRQSQFQSLLNKKRIEKVRISFDNTLINNLDVLLFRSKICLMMP